MLGPEALLTVTSTVPVPRGERAVMEVFDLTRIRLALADPNLTAVAPVKLMPVIVTGVPPLNEPESGWT
jgi:hypothetical protein